ncbi:MAG: topoisomerase IV [Clostridia bacterium]|nr:topoisomerase IV [Clostridia bacterium]
MAKRKKSSDTTAQPKMQGYIAGAGEVVEEKIAFTLQENFMPYAMSIIMSRAIPEIDGFKPSHRKLLYTMYKMGLLGATRTKSANIVGQTMKLNPHGDAAIYDTMVRLSRGYEALLHPFVDSKGNFGKYYSRDMAWAASRYTEAKLDPICSELFNDIDKDTVDFVDNYDNTLKEPALLPAAFPSVLVNANTGIAVGMASSICSFNLEEVCRTTIGLLKDPDFDIMSTLIAPDFTGGAQIIYDRQAIENVYSTGRGSIRLRARYTYDKYANCIDILSIPQTTTVEAVIEKVIDLVKQSKIREIADIRDETGIDGLKITIDLKRGTNPDKLMQKLYKITSLEDTFSCNFNVLIAGTPKVLGVRELLNEWSAFRIECVKRRTYYDLHKKQDRLHLLRGLEKILLDIDKAIRIIRGTEEESMVVPNLMEGFGIDELQAEYVAEIKLRHLNREYILRHTNDISQLEKDIAELESVLGSSKKIKAIIIKELENIIKKYAQPRRSMIIYADDIVEDEVEEDVPDYPVNLFFTKEGYFKKITPLSLRMGGEQKLKEGDEVIEHIETTNNSEIIFFSDRQQAYKVKTPQFADTKASVLGDYIPSKLGFDEGENAVYMISTKDYKGFVFFFFENGKAAKVSMDAYATKTNRKKLTGAYSDKDKLAAVIYAPDDDTEILLKSSSGRRLLFKASDLSTKTSRAAQGVALMKLTKGHRLISATIYTDGMLSDPSRYRAKNLPAMGQFTGADEAGEQITF